MELTAREFELNRERLKDVVHYVCASCDPRELGNVKLHKVLYFADMLHFMDTGEPLTGVRYCKQRFGPVATHLTWAIDELVSSGRLRVDKRDYFGYQKKDFCSLVEPQRARLSNLALAILDDAISFVTSRSAREISELSHNAAWDAVGIGEEISYYSAYWMQPTVVTDEDVRIAEGVVRMIPELAGEAS